MILALSSHHGKLYTTAPLLVLSTKDEGSRQIFALKSMTTKANGPTPANLTSSTAAKWKAWCRILIAYLRNPTNTSNRADGPNFRVSNWIAFVTMIHGKRRRLGWGGARICIRRRGCLGRIWERWGRGRIRWGKLGFGTCRALLILSVSPSQSMSPWYFLSNAWMMI